MDSTTPLIDLQELKRLTKAAFGVSQLQSKFETLNRNYGLKLPFQRPDRVYQKGERILAREEAHLAKDRQAGLPERIGTGWVFGQHKLFATLACFMCIIEGIEIRKMGHHHVYGMHRILRCKKLIFLQHELNCLMTIYHPPAVPWREDEVDLLRRIMLTCAQGEHVWRTVSYMLFEMSGGVFFRTIKQCRDRWTNHINPIIVKSKWTLEEDQRLFELTERYGLKWSKISKEFGEIRTEHMVKNRYLRYCRQAKRREKPVEIFFHEHRIAKMNNQSKLPMVEEKSLVVQSEQEQVKKQPTEQQIVPSPQAQPSIAVKHEEMSLSPMAIAVARTDIKIEEMANPILQVKQQPTSQSYYPFLHGHYMHYPYPPMPY